MSFFPSYLIGVLGLSVVCLEFPRLHDVKLTLLSLSGMFLTILISNAIAGHDIEITMRYFGYVLLILTYIIGFYICSRQVPWFLQAFMTITVGAATVSSLLSIGFYFLLDYQPLDEQRLYALGRLNNPVISAISYGSILCLVLPFTAETREIGLRFLAGTIAISLIAAIMLTETRGVWLALAVSLLVVFTMHEWRSKTQLLATMGGMAIVLLLLTVILHQLGYTDVILKRSLSFRPEIWRATINAWLDAGFWFGAGIATTIELNIPPNKFLHPHSIYLSTLYYGGVIGLLSFLFFIARLLWVLKHTTERNLKIYAAPLLMFGLVVLLFDGNKIIEKVDFLWLCLWLPVAILMVSEDKTTPQHH